MSWSETLTSRTGSSTRMVASGPYIPFHVAVGLGVVVQLVGESFRTATDSLHSMRGTSASWRTRRQIIVRMTWRFNGRLSGCPS